MYCIRCDTRYSFVFFFSLDFILLCYKDCYWQRHAGTLIRVVIRRTSCVSRHKPPLPSSCSYNNSSSRSNSRSCRMQSKDIPGKCCTLYNNVKIQAFGYVVHVVSYQVSYIPVCRRSTGVTEVPGTTPGDADMRFEGKRRTFSKNSRMRRTRRCFHYTRHIGDQRSAQALTG